MPHTFEMPQKHIDSMVARMGREHSQETFETEKTALVVVDMPFGSYETNADQAFLNAARIMKETGCQAVKLESGAYAAHQISHLVERGVPVVLVSRDQTKLEALAGDVLVRLPLASQRHAGRILAHAAAEPTIRIWDMARCVSAPRARWREALLHRVGR